MDYSREAVITASRRGSAPGVWPPSCTTSCCGPGSYRWGLRVAGGGGSHRARTQLALPGPAIRRLRADKSPGLAEMCKLSFREYSKAILHNPFAVW